MVAKQNKVAALPSIDPFQNITPLPPSTSDACESETICPTEVTKDFTNLCQADNDSDWEYEDDDFNRNAFDFNIDDDDEWLLNSNFLINIKHC